MESIVSYAKEAVTYQKKIIFNAGVESSLDYAEPTKNYVPKIGLLFSPFGLPFVPLEVLGSNVGSIIKSLAWTKDRNNPGGILSVTVVPDLDTVKDIFNIIGSIPGGNLYTRIWKELGYDFEDLFKPMTLCQLWIDGYHVMTGTVRSCVRSSQVGASDYSAEYSIMFDELGNIYTKSTISLETIVMSGLDMNVMDSLSPAMEGVAKLKGVTVSKGILALVNAFTASTLYKQGMSMSDGFPLAMRLLAMPNPIGGIANLSFASNMFANGNLFEISNQSFWDYMRNFVPTPWMEFFTESGGRTIVTESVGVPTVMFPGFNYIVARSTPYSNPMLGTVHPLHYPAILPFDLSTIQMLLGGDFVIITDDDIHNKSIGFDGSAQATSFRVKYTAGVGTQAYGICDKPILSFGPLNPLASGGLGTFGLSEMHETINCSQLYDFGSVTESLLNTAISKLSTVGVFSKTAMSNLLAVWFRNQSRFREGSITTRMKPWARAGMYCLYLPTLSGSKPENSRDIGIYYIDSLSHNYELSNEAAYATTTLNLIRGVPLPTTLAKAAMLLFDYEILPPMSGLWDGEGAVMQALRLATKI